MESKTSSVVINDDQTSTESDISISQLEKLSKNDDNINQSDPLPIKFVKKLINFFFDFLETIVVALSIFVVIYLFIVQPHEVKGNSMEPNFHNNEYILTDKLSFRFTDPKRGDVVIFKAPINPEVDYIKRVIGLPGEKIEIRDGKVFVNGRELPENYLTDKTYIFPGSSFKEGVEVKLAEDEYFVMGDNRSHSSDSREFGPISKKLIIGKAFLRYWPIKEIGRLSEFNYK